MKALTDRRLSPAPQLHDQGATFSVCVDCMIWACNRDDSGCSDEWRDWRDSLTDARKMIVLAAGIVGEDQGFVHRHCDLCDALPGDRFELIDIAA